MTTKNVPNITRIKLQQQDDVRTYTAGKSLRFSLTVSVLSVTEFSLDDAYHECISLASTFRMTAWQFHNFAMQLATSRFMPRLQSFKAFFIACDAFPSSRLKFNSRGCKFSAKLASKRCANCAKLPLIAAKLPSAHYQGNQQVSLPPFAVLHEPNTRRCTQLSLHESKFQRIRTLFRPGLSLS